MKIEKKLKSIPIVPQEFYIERDADRQIEKILEEMGRPGYVLVARQMGKTNLLLNSKNKIIAAGDFFIYLDVSNKFDSISDFFRNIIDTFFDLYPHVGHEVKLEIQNIRLSSIKTPHKEHEFELRKILSLIKGRLIICLDEIDALTKSNYSDQVFSFVRSLYFAGRANFDEFKRLTYILSGVAEPADIIKNKDISPFNIGERIYLNDFSEGESIQLVKNTIIPDNTGISERIYYWASGNPRMTWDIASELEGCIEKGESVTPQTVDKIVDALYFSEVERPPIDHIKKIVADSLELRDALVEMHYKRSDGISDSMRSKIYLSGISKPSIKEDSVLFKNKIIEDSLSEEFLLKLNTKSPDFYYQQGVVAFDSKEYDEAISHFRVSIKNQDSKYLHESFLYLIKSYYFSAEYDSIIKIIDEYLKKDGYEDILNSSIEISYFLGASFLRKKFYAESIQQLSKLDFLNEEFFYAKEAFIDYIESKNQLQCEFSNDDVNLINFFFDKKGEILNSNKIYRNSSEIVSKIVFFKIVLEKENPEFECIDLIDEYLNFAGLNTKIEFLVMKHDLHKNASSRSASLKEGLQMIKKCKGFAECSFAKDDVVEVVNLYQLASRISLAGKDLSELINHVIFESKSGLSEHVVLHELAMLSVDKNDEKLAVEIIDAALRIAEDNISPLVVRKLIRTMAVIDASKSQKYIVNLLNTFDEKNEVSVDDIASLNNIVLNNNYGTSFVYAKRALTLIDRFCHSNNELSLDKTESLILIRDYLESVINFSLRPNQLQISFAKKVYDRAIEIKNFNFPGFGDNYREGMIRGVNSNLKKYGYSAIEGIKRKYKRNDKVKVKYLDLIKEGKFKKYEADIRAGICEIID